MSMAENRYTFTTSSGVRGDTVITALAGIDSGSTRTGRVVTTRSGHDPAVSRARRRGPSGVSALLPYGR
jgi:hypothetical protein